MESIAARILLLKKDLRCTQEQLGKYAHVHKQAVWQWLNGKSKPGRDALMMLKRTKGVNPEWVLRGEEPMYLARRSHAENAVYPSNLYEPAGVNEERPATHAEIVDEEALLASFRRLPRREQRYLRRIAEALFSEQAVKD